MIKKLNNNKGCRTVKEIIKIIRTNKNKNKYINLTIK